MGPGRGSPPGHPGDTFPVLASSGERVIIETAGQQAAGGHGEGQTRGSAPTIQTMNVTIQVQGHELDNPRLAARRLAGAVADEFGNMARG